MSIVEDFEKADDDLELNSYDNFANNNPKSTDTSSSSDGDKVLRLKCSNVNDFLFIGLTQYGVSNASSAIDKSSSVCQISPNDCLISVDYIANQCNGLNSCDIQLDSQFLHSCRNHSDYINIAYECIPGSKRMDVCSNDETFVIDSSWSMSPSRKSASDSSLTSRFGSFYLSSPSYPSEYGNNLNNCSCQLEYVTIDTNTQSSSNEPASPGPSDEMNLLFKTYEFDLEEDEEEKGEGEEEQSNSNEVPANSNNLRQDKCSKDNLRIESSILDEATRSPRSSTINLCGQYKDFKEFYAKGNRFNFHFSTDDVITRRGFLLKIEPIAETECPHGSRRFSSTKCVKHFGDERSGAHAYSNKPLSWLDAHKACQALNGRLLTINDFVDNLKLNAYLRARITEKIHRSIARSGGSIRNNNHNQTQHSTVQFDQFNVAYWSNINKEDRKFLNVMYSNNNSGGDHHKCLSKKINFWQEAICQSRKAYICEFDAISLRPAVSAPKPAPSLNNGNRLIRVKCGRGSTPSPPPLPPKSTASTQSSPKKFSRPPHTIKATQRPIKLISIIHSQKTSEPTQATAASITEPTKPVSNSILPTIMNVNSISDEELEDTLEVANSENRVIPTTKTAAKASAAAVESKSYFNFDLILIVAVVCGISIVLIAINVFCIWNYYNKKLKGYFRKPNMDAEAEAAAVYQQRTSTLIRNKTNRSNSSSTNRTLSSTVDSYAKVPPYDVCLSLNHQNNAHLNQIDQACESSSSASLLAPSSNSSPNSTTKLTTGDTANSMDYLKTFLHLASASSQQQQQLQHFYETICAKEYQKSKQVANVWHNYAEYNPLNHVNLIDLAANNCQPKFDSFVMLPSGQLIQSAALPVNSTVLLINPQPQHVSSSTHGEEQQYSTCLYGELPSAANNSTLVTFSSNNGNSANSGSSTANSENN